MPCSSGRPASSSAARRTATRGPSTSGLSWSWRSRSAICRRAAVTRAASRCGSRGSSAIAMTRQRPRPIPWTPCAAFTPPRAAAHLPSAARRRALGLRTMDMESCDVAVIGGGPAGSTVGALLARRGHRVVLLEKARHPRFHIGESLLPANLPLFERLGVLEQVRAIGMQKWGAEFVSPWHGKAYTFEFADAWNKSLQFAFQVRRSQFDEILIRRAAHQGA